MWVGLFVFGQNLGVEVSNFPAMVFFSTHCVRRGGGGALRLHSVRQNFSPIIWTLWEVVKGRYPLAHTELVWWHTLGSLYLASVNDSNSKSQWLQDKHGSTACIGKEFRQFSNTNCLKKDFTQGDLLSIFRETIHFQKKKHGDNWFPMIFDGNIVTENNCLLHYQVLNSHRLPLIGGTSGLNTVNRANGIHWVIEKQWTVTETM